MPATSVKPAAPLASVVGGLLRLAVGEMIAVAVFVLMLVLEVVAYRETAETDRTTRRGEGIARRRRLRRDQPAARRSSGQV